jgi:DNA-binding GntR family transcriptional regulator
VKLEMKLKAKIDQESMAEKAYRRIEEMIVMQDLLPGSMISEAQLGQELGCGRTPVREALQRLKLEGYIDVHPRRGALVTPVDVLKQLELLEVRRSLEDLGARLASVRATGAERRRLIELADEIDAAAGTGDRAKFYEANKAIHETVAEKTIRAVHGLSRRFWYAYIGEEQMKGAAKLHAKVVTSIAHNAPADAAEQVVQLMDYLESLTRMAIERRI